ncbi:hypothetical protein IAR55_003879 [Kwoniella newhampshirensis]|uniref:Nuclear pore complex protein n=1 Tax=Kwoniella newhampshirensis TaxID=1651941 RepID=A0AAW0YYF5_9TREE
MMATSSHTPYQTFAKVFSSYHDQYAKAGPSSNQLDSPIRADAVLDEQGGLIIALMGSLEETIRSKNPTNNSAFDMDDDEQISAEEHGALLAEHRTWQLLRALYENRLHRSDPSFVAPSSKKQILENPYASPEDVIQTMVNEDQELSLWATLVDHLQTRPLLSSPPPLEARHGYLPSTVRRAKASRSGVATSTGTSLDPDFTLRDPHGSGLAGEDQTYQNPLLETLWDLVRHGELDQAIKLCEQGGEPWRGASLMGGRRWSMGGMTKDSMDLSPMEGNRRRVLWKKCCRAIAKNPTLIAAERHLYAALISDLPTLLPACQSWEDHLWAHVQHRIENRIEQRWHELGGFWEAESAYLGKDDNDAELAYGGLEEVFASMSGLQDPGIALAARDPYHVAQRMIILGRTEGLLNQFANQLPKIEATVSPDLIGPLIRFFAHLVLVLRTLGQTVPDTSANAIVQAYLMILEREGNDELVAMYAACLREGSGEESYARFLRAMDPSATREARREALSRAKQHNLDVAVIAKETVRMVLSEAFNDIPSLSVAEPDITAVSVGLSERDVHLIRSIEWLTMMDETMGEALIKSNDVARYFLALGQANAAHSLLKTLPTSLTMLATSANPDEDPDCHLLEHASFQRLFSVFASHDVVDDIAARQPKVTATKMEVHNWRKGLLGAIEKVWENTVELVEGDWLRFRVGQEDEHAEQRREELSLIRHTFIPDLILRLHHLLLTHSTLFPDLLKRAMELIQVVAEEDNHIYDEFLPRARAPGAGGAGKLVVYLEKVREVGLEVLKLGGGEAFGVTV